MAQHSGESKTGSKIQGEGDYVSGREFQDAEREFVREGRVEQAAREAADALSGPEAEDLEAARRATARGHAAHRERKLDQTLDDTFPASDPLPTTPGAD
jgi:hypothetical protein